MGKGVKILRQDCDPSLAEDRSLPYTAFLVEYKQDGMTKFDYRFCCKAGRYL